MTQQEIQLKTPCRVLIENLKHNQTASSNASDESSPKSESTPTERRRKRVKRAKQREVQSDGGTPSVRKMSDEELKKKLTPLKVEIKLLRLGLDDYSIVDNTTPKTTAKKRARKSFTNHSILEMEFSDSDYDNDQDLTFTRKKQEMEKSSVEVENQMPIPDTVTVRNRPRKNPGTPARTSKCGAKLKTQTLTVKMFTKSPKIAKKIAATQKAEETEKGKGVKKRAETLKRKLDDTAEEKKTEKLETNSKVGRPKKAETDSNEAETDGQDAAVEKQPPLIQQAVGPIDEDIEMVDQLIMFPSKAKDLCSSVSEAKKPSKLRGPKSKRDLVEQKAAKIASAPLPAEDLPIPNKTQKDRSPLPVEPHKPKKLKPMPLSKKRQLGLVIDDDLIIDSETVCNVKVEMKSPEVPTAGKNGSGQQDFMSSFLHRLSMEDPLEGTSRQNVYKKPQAVPSHRVPEKKSLRHMEKKTYQESPVSDTAPTDDDATWYPPKESRHK